MLDLVAAKHRSHSVARMTWWAGAARLFCTGQERNRGSTIYSRAGMVALVTLMSGLHAMQSHFKGPSV